MGLPVAAKGERGETGESGPPSTTYVSVTGVGLDEIIHDSIYFHNSMHTSTPRSKETLIPGELEKYTSLPHLLHKI